MLKLFREGRRPRAEQRLLSSVSEHGRNNLSTRKDRTEMPVGSVIDASVHGLALCKLTPNSCCCGNERHKRDGLADLVISTTAKLRYRINITID